MLKTVVPSSHGIILGYLIQWPCEWKQCILMWGKLASANFNTVESCWAELAGQGTCIFIMGYQSVVLFQINIQKFQEI